MRGDKNKGMIKFNIVSAFYGLMDSWVRVWLNLLLVCLSVVCIQLQCPNKISFLISLSLHVLTSVRASSSPFLDFYFTLEHY